MPESAYADGRPAARIEAAAEALRGRAVLLFDLDGTLYGIEEYGDFAGHMDEVSGRLLVDRYGVADSREAAEALARDQRRYGLPSKSAALERLHGISLAEMNRHREAHVRPGDFLEPDPEMDATLALLQASYDLVLATNSTKLLAEKVLGCLGIDGSRFRLIVDSEEAGCAKPEPGFFLYVLGLHPAPAARWLSIGDRPASDLEPARNLGMGTWLVRSPRDVVLLAEGHRRLQRDRG